MNDSSATNNYLKYFGISILITHCFAYSYYYSYSFSLIIIIIADIHGLELFLFTHYNNGGAIFLKLILKEFFDLTAEILTPK